MHLTSADARAAREGFHFVVFKGGKRVCYTTTAAEAKRECGKGGKVYPLSRMRYAAQNPTARMVGLQRNPSFARWLDTFLEEKEIGLEEVLEVKGREWGTNYIPVGVLVQVMKRAPKHEQEAIKTMLVKIDFRNAPVRPYLAHLGQAIARNPAKRNPTWTTAALLAGAAYVYGRSSTVREGVHSAVRGAYAGAKESLAKKLEKKANPGLTKAGKRHLIKTMHKAGADTFKKKMAYVRRHMPHVTDPAAFVGYVMQGEKR